MEARSRRLGNGYATEAAHATPAFAFETLDLPEIFAVTTVGSLRSQGVMRRIGMTRDPAVGFAVPTVPDGPLWRCILYRMARTAT